MMSSPVSSHVAIAILAAAGVAVALLVVSALRRRKRRAGARARGNAAHRLGAAQPGRPAPIGLHILSATDLDVEHGLTTSPVQVAPAASAGDPDLLAAAHAAVASAAQKLARRQGLIEALLLEGGDPQDLTTLIQKDPDLAGRILERINGPEYAVGTPIDQVSRAAVLLGYGEVRLQAWRQCLGEGIEPSSSMTAGAFDCQWRHAFTVSRAAQALAVTVNLPRPDILATAGLLHDIGKLVALAHWPARARSFDNVRFSDGRAQVAELGRLGVSHAHLGALFCEALRLPPEVSRVIAEHHAPSYGPPDRMDAHAMAVAVVHLADVLGHLVERHLRSFGGQVIYRPAAGWLELLKQRRIEDLLVPSVVLALLDPSAVWRGTPGVRRAA